MPTASGHTSAIRASRVIGTDIFTPGGKTIGKVQDIVLDKTQEKIMFAIVNLGGALVATDNFCALPWASLNYEEKQKGYVVPYSEETFVSAPSVSNVSELTEDDGGPFYERTMTHFVAG